ncbi:MAG: ACT domain-containing protein [Defluviitaleaceae bacterium]|nr:ACT domain-containing protein [Defluviitaleaceae bacterium]
MQLEILAQDFSICKLEDMGQVDFTKGITFAAKTADEISLVCETAYAPQNTIAHEPGWRGLKVSGVLDFSLVGILAGITNTLANGGISIFAVSTYDTDYILVKAVDFDKAMSLLADGGYVVA